ncbi:hypothetical protein AZF37_08845 [endosymbiont 'TC1' of Trimyema compressum]|nr:hypothetical protein AZF37_08845 [endosymbiont 'TC1' of Trimyema compressum]
MFKIGEFSKLTLVSIRMLRYYDEVDLLKPTTINEESGYRLYDIEAIPKLKKIIFLRYLNFMTAEIKEALKDWSDNALIKLLKNKESEIETNIAIEAAKLEKINKAFLDIGEAFMDVHQNVTIKGLESQNVIVLRGILETPDTESILWQQLFDFIIKENIKLPKNYRNIAIFHDLEHKEQDVDVEVCIEVEKLNINQGPIIFRATEPLKTVASMMIYGPFSYNIKKGYFKLAEWLSAHPYYEILGASRQVLHKGPGNEENPENYMT